MPAEMTLRDHWADAMLRCRAGADCPGQDNASNLDAAPEARAGTPGTGDTQEPVAWGLMRVGGRWVSILNSSVQAETSRQSFDKMENWVHEVVPLYRRPQPTLTDAERRAVEECVRFAFPATHPTAATLRGLLERMK